MNDFIVKQLVGGTPDLERRLRWWADNFQWRISQAVDRMQTGRITLAEFQHFGRDELRDTYYGIAETGAGRRLTRKEIYQVRTVLKEQLAFWDRFCQAIADQRQALLDEGLKGDELEDAFNNLYDKFTRRAQSYAGAIEAEGQKWAMARLYRDGQWFVWRLSEAEHCETCIERDGTIAQMKDGRLPYYPKDGTTICLYNCLCRWQPISRFRAMALRALGRLKRVVSRKSFEEMVDEVVEKHYGPGPHPGTGTPQSVHGKKGRIGKAGRAPEGPDTTSEAANTFLNKGLFPERMPGVGATAGTTLWKGAPDDVRKKAKAEIVSTLAEKTSIPEEDVNAFIGQWAHSSNDYDKRSLAIQEDAAREFNIPLSKFTKGQIDKLSREATMIADIEDVTVPELPSVGEAKYTPLMSSNKQRAILRAMYENTQEKLSAAGFKPEDTIRLRRGVRLPHSEVRDWKEGNVKHIKGNALESWSIGEAAAKSFATGGKAEQRGIVFEMDVPVSSIIGSARTGFGCLREGEFVTIGLGGEAKVIFITGGT